jgi:hypothetical protein
MSNVFRYTALLAAALCLWACHVHEFPVGSSEVDVTLHLAFDKSLPPFRTVEYPQTKAADAETAGLEVQYQIRLYRGVPGDFEQEPFLIQTYIGDDVTSLERDVTLNLKPGRYLAQVWVDFVSEEKGPAYEATDFRHIGLMGDYPGGDVRQEAFYVQCELPLETLITAGSTYEDTLTLKRPLAQYRFIATDKEEFLKFWSRERAIRHGSSVKTAIPESQLNTYAVRVVYPQYLPNAFNLFTDHAADAGTGYSFWTRMQLREDGDVDLGWDWVIVGPEEGVVVVALEFYDATGEYISTVNNITVPLMRGQVTTVKGTLLTRGVDSGVTIDPTYDGEYNVQF